MKTKEYYELCKEYDGGSLFSDCFKNEHFTEDKDVHRVLAEEGHHWFTHTNELKTTCSDGYCPCDAS